MYVEGGESRYTCVSNCPFSQGVDNELIDKMKGNEIVIREMLRRAEEENGKRAYIKNELIVLQLNKKEGTVYK